MKDSWHIQLSQLIKVLMYWKLPTLIMSSTVRTKDDLKRLILQMSQVKNDMI